MFAFEYPATFRRDSSGRLEVSFAALPEAHTDGKDFDEAMEEAVDCLGSALAARMANREEIPQPGALKRGQKHVPVPLWIASKLALHLSMKEQRISNSELARRLGVGETVVRRMLDPNHATRPANLERALRVLGKRMVVNLASAA